jgi:hypothetical protein
MFIITLISDLDRTMFAVLPNEYGAENSKSKENPIHGQNFPVYDKTKYVLVCAAVPSDLILCILPESCQRVG